MNTHDSDIQRSLEPVARPSPRSPDPPALRVLVLSRNYPHQRLSTLGLWARHLVQSVTGFAEAKVVAPVPYVPRLVERFSSGYTSVKDVPRQRWDGPVEVFHPRLMTGPGQCLHALDAASYVTAVMPTVHRLRRVFPFDVIHAQSTYPDGVAAVVLGYLYGIPVIITEGALWLPWMRHQRLIRHQAVWAARECNAHIAMSHGVRDHIRRVTGIPDKVRVIRNVQDRAALIPALHQERNPDQLLWLGNEYAALVGPMLRLNVQARLAAAQPGLDRPWTDLTGAPA